MVFFASLSIALLAGLVLSIPSTTASQDGHQKPLLESKGFERRIVQAEAWRLKEWRAVDDRVRGGNSQSFLTVNDEPEKGVVFHGFLDTETLGGAGFCSQRLLFNERDGEGGALDFSSFSQLKIRFEDIGDDSIRKILAVNLYDNRPSDRGDGRNKSQVIYKATFPLDGLASGEIVLNWADFKPNFRGRDKPDAPSINLRHIYGISIMMQSFFDTQKGPFSIGISTISLLSQSNPFLPDNVFCDSNQDSAAGTQRI